MKKSLVVVALVLLVSLWAGAASADVVCGANCGNWFGTAACITSSNPATGCSQWGANCMSVSSPDCGGGAGCGFNGEYCGPDNQY